MQNNGEPSSLPSDTKPSTSQLSSTPSTPPMSEMPLPRGPQQSPLTPVHAEQAATAPPPPPPPPPSLGTASSNATQVASSPLPPPPPPPPPQRLPLNKNVVGRAIPTPPPPPPRINAGSLAPDPLQPPLCHPPPSSSPPPPPPPPPPRITASPQSKKLKHLYWLKLPRVLCGTLWDEAQTSSEASRGPDIDMLELETLFLASAPNLEQGGKSRRNSSRGPKAETLQLIEHRRAYDCEIMLLKVNVPLQDLMSSVLTLEESALDADQVENLIKFCPAKEEMELLKGYTGDKEKLGKCEQFFLELMKVPRVESKLRVFWFKKQFHSQVMDLKTSLNIVNSAAEQIRNSIKLKRIMQTILTLGNALNQGTYGGAAIGFRLDSLLKLSETHDARTNQMTLMHYLCKILDEKLPEVLDFANDFVSLEPATKIQLKFLAKEMQAISKGLENLEQELYLSKNDGPISDHFRNTMKEFLNSAESEVRALVSLYSDVGRNLDALSFYFCEDPAKYPFEQVVSTLLNFARLFNRAHEENCKQDRTETSSQTSIQRGTVE